MRACAHDCLSRAHVTCLRIASWKNGRGLDPSCEEARFLFYFWGGGVARVLVAKAAGRALQGITGPTTDTIECRYQVLIGAIPVGKIFCRLALPARAVPL